MILMKTRLAALTVLFLAFASGTTTAQRHSPATDHSDRAAVIWVFFRTDHGPSGSDHDAAVADHQRATRVDALRDAGAVIRHVTRWLNGASVVIDQARVAELRRLPFVREIRPVLRSRRWIDPERRRLNDAGADDPGVVGPESGTEGRQAPTRTDFRLDPTVPGTVAAPAFLNDEAWYYGASFNQNAQVGIVDLHRQGYTGAGTIVAILDSGFRTGHPALAGRNVLAERDFVFNDNDVDNQPNDVASAWNHGTSVWSNVGGYRPGALIGGAFEAGILLAKTENITSETPVEEDNFIAAIEWADSLGADIITASLLYLDFDGTMNDYTYADLDGDTTPLAIAVDMAVARGICMVNAAGNFGPGVGSIWTPADADSVLSVGAVDSLGVVTSFSSRGPTADGRVKPEVVARGRSNYVANATTGGYGPASGTSFATPVTAGAAALLKEAHPDWSGWQLREAIRSQASHAGAPDNMTGWGLVRLNQAAALAPQANPLVSRPFSLQMPDRGVTITTAAPQFGWEHSRGNPGDVVTYRVILGTSPTFAGADTFFAGTDSTWIPPMFLAPGSTYHWQVLATNLAGWEREALRPGKFTVSTSAGVADIGRAGFPVRPMLAGPYPNPVTHETRLSMSLPARAEVSTWSVNVVGVDGRLVRRLAAGAWERAGGTVDLVWDGRDERGGRAASGIYFVRLVTPEWETSRRLILARE